MDVRRATSNDITAVSTALAHAFADDPVMNWTLGPRNRLARQRKLFAVLLRAFYLQHDETWTTTAGVAGAAIWAPPKKWRMGIMDSVRAAPTVLRVIGRRLPTVMRGMTVIDKHHLKEPHYYLAILGTEPSQQGKGIGSALLAPMLQRCDEERALAYLESSKEENIPFYQRHGFVLQETLQLPDGPPLWPMVREPHP